MNDWLAILKESVAGEWDNPPPIAALATVDSIGHPHVRHVVCRRINDDGNIWITSDARTAKNQHVRDNPNAELALWLPQKREQFRIAGTISMKCPIPPEPPSSGQHLASRQIPSNPSPPPSPPPSIHRRISKFWCLRPSRWNTSNFPPTPIAAAAGSAPPTGPASKSIPDPI